MDDTTRLALPLVAPAQAQKHVTVNEAFTRLDGLVQAAVMGTGSAPPGSPEEGECWIVGAAPTGDWQGWAGDLALFAAGGWLRLRAREGWRVWDMGAQAMQLRRAEGWGPMETGGLDAGALAEGVLERLGVATGSDSVNRLAVAGDATLLTHAGGGHQLKINKAAPGDTASLLYQTGWSGRAEMGLAGDDDFAVKVSPDGAAWHTALRVERATGQVVTPAGRRDAVSGGRISEMLWTPGGAGITTVVQWNTDASMEHGQNPRSEVIDSVSGDEITFASPDVRGTFGLWSGYMEGASHIRVWNLDRSPVQSAWIRAMPGNGTIAVLDSAHIVGWQAGDRVQIGDPTNRQPGRVVAVDISPMLRQVFGTVFRQTGIVVRGQLHTPEAGGRLELTPDGTTGSFVQAVTSVGGGAFTAGGTTMMPCVVPSPVSDSNLLLYREVLATTATVCALGSVAITV